MANANRVTSTADETVQIWITDLIEADYAARNVFPAIRRAQAISVTGTKREYRVSRSEAEAIYEDAEKMRSQRRRGRPGKGLSLAYCATANRMWGEFRKKDKDEQAPAIPTKGLLALFDEMRAAEHRGCALPEGTRILYFHPGDNEGHSGAIVKPYCFQKIDDPSGEFIDTDGSPFSYRPGYLVHLDGEERSGFAPAHCITLDDCKPAHLRLVS